MYSLVNRFIESIDLFVFRIFGLGVVEKYKEEFIDGIKVFFSRCFGEDGSIFKVMVFFVILDLFVCSFVSEIGSENSVNMVVYILMIFFRVVIFRIIIVIFLKDNI